MTANVETTETKVLNIHRSIADLVVGYTVCVEDDGAGPYISLHNPADIEDYRCLSLSEEACGEDLSLYRWNFWNHNNGSIYLESALGADASEEEVLAFLAECLTEEARVRNAMA